MAINRRKLDQRAEEQMAEIAAAKVKELVEKRLWFHPACCIPTLLERRKQSHHTSWSLLDPRTACHFLPGAKA